MRLVEIAVAQVLISAHLREAHITMSPSGSGLPSLRVFGRVNLEYIISLRVLLSCVLSARPSSCGTMRLSVFHDHHLAMKFLLLLVLTVLSLNMKVPFPTCSESFCVSPVTALSSV